MGLSQFALPVFSLVISCGFMCHMTSGEHQGRPYLLLSTFSIVNLRGYCLPFFSADGKIDSGRIG